MTQQNYIEDVVSEPETCNSDNSQDDPTFEIIQETQSKFSNLSIKKKSRSRVPVEADDDDVNSTEIVAPVFNATDEKSFETVQKIIEVGMVEKLKVEQCKLYLRKHGLRLMGKKDILIHRIKEHISIMKGEGEHKYPPSSFVMNCKGDACTGDVVMFEQNVYEMFNIASRNGGGPPSGKRIVAGRIVKESYGAAKQQHTFTIEVLWSKGEKPLPPLHPLLIKGRNLYRLKTMRQRWEDESQRQKILSEKHGRGNAARNNREVRLHEKETRKALRENRALKGKIKNETQEQKINTSPVRTMIKSRNPENLPANHRPLVSMIHNHHGVSYNENINPSIVRGPVDGSFRKSHQVEQNMGFNPSRMFERREYDRRENMYHPHNPSQNYSFRQGNNNGHLPRNEGSRQQLCRYYAQGRCHYGTNCRYLH